MVQLTAWAEIADTENEGKVRMVIENLFLVSPKISDKAKVSFSHVNLSDFKNNITVKKIGKTVFRQLMKNQEEKKTRLYFNKQAGFLGKFNLVEKYEDSPLGAVVLELPMDYELFYWLTGVLRSPQE